MAKYSCCFMRELKGFFVERISRVENKLRFTRDIKLLALEDLKVLGKLQHNLMRLGFNLNDLLSRNTAECFSVFPSSLLAKQIILKSFEDVYLFCQFMLNLTEQ